MISVCMATYNGERFIKEQIASILSQLSENDELIISDDGSTDRTLEIIASFNDSRIKLLHHKHNPAYEKIKHSRSFYYATDNFENALKEAKGDYIFLSDQDDVWAGNKVEKMIVELKNYDLAMCNFSVIDNLGNVVQKVAYESSPVRKHIFQYLLKFKMVGCCLAITKQGLIKSLPFPKKLLAHDLWICCCNINKTKFINEPLHFYRRHNENVSFGITKSKNSIFYRIFYRFELMVLFVRTRLFVYKN